jgi:hypothetical protein
MPDGDEAAERAANERIAMRIAAVAADLDAVASRAVRELKTMEALGASPNKLLAVRTAIQTTAQAAARLRRDGWLGDDTQQRLL